MLKKKIFSLFFALVFVVAMSGLAEATVATKQVKVNYSNIKMNVNGKTINPLPAQEPFMINGTTFVPLRLAGEALNCSVNWLGQTKTINITGGTSSTELAVLTAQISQKNKEIEDLKKKVAALEDQEAQEAAEDDDIDDVIEELEDDLNDDYDELEDVAIKDIKVDGDEDDVEVEIEVDLGKDDDEWKELENDDIEEWLEDLVEDIQDALDNDTDVDGEIIDIDSDDKLIDFEKKGRRSLDVDFKDEDYRGGDGDKVADELEDESFKVDDINFEVDKAHYYEDDDRVDVDLDAKYDSAYDDWNSLSTTKIKDEVDDICDDIVKMFDDEGVSIYLIYINFYDKDGDSLSNGNLKYDDGDLTIK